MQNVLWTVDDNSLGSVNSQGLLTARKNGIIIVTAESQDGTGIQEEIAIELTNQKIEIESLEIVNTNESNLINIDDGTLDLSYDYLPEDATEISVNWEISSGNEYLSVDPLGHLLALRDGISTVLCTSESGVTDEISIEVQNQVIYMESISIYNAEGSSSISAFEGSLQLEASFFPLDATNSTLNWQCTNQTGEASVDSEGVVTAEYNGTVLITASSTDGTLLSDTFEINITNNPGRDGLVITVDFQSPEDLDIVFSGTTPVLDQTLGDSMTLTSNISNVEQYNWYLD